MDGVADCASQAAGVGTRGLAKAGGWERDASRRFAVLSQTRRCRSCILFGARSCSDPSSPPTRIPPLWICFWQKPLLVSGVVDLFWGLPSLVIAVAPWCFRVWEGEGARAGGDSRASGVQRRLRGSGGVESLAWGAPLSFFYPRERSGKSQQPSTAQPNDDETETDSACASLLLNVTAPRSRPRRSTATSRCTSTSATSRPPPAPGTCTATPTR